MIDRLVIDDVRGVTNSGKSAIPLWAPTARVSKVTCTRLYPVLAVAEAHGRGVAWKRGQMEWS